MQTNKCRKLFSYISLVVLLAISVLTWQYFEKMAIEREERRYNEYVNSVVKDVIERLDKHIMILLGGAALFHSSEDVTGEEWQAYYQYQQVSTHYPGIQGVAFSRVVQSPDLEQHIEEIRAEDFSDYMVWPAGERDLYAPIVFLEPFDEQNRHYFGYDLFSEAVLRTVMEHTLDTGEVSMSAKASLMQETDDGTQSGFLMFAPVYAQGMPLNSPEERRKANEGYFFGTYFLTELMQDIFPDTRHNIDFSIYDGPEVSSEALMYFSDVSLDAPGNEHRPLFTSAITLDLYGHQWTMVFETTSIFEAVVDQYTPKVILAACILISLLLFFYLRTLDNIDDRAHSLAQKMTATLKESEDRHRLLTENITDVIWTVDLEGRLTYISPAIEQLLGFTPEEIIKMPMYEYIVREDCETMMTKLVEELAKPPAERAHFTYIQACCKTKDNRLIHVELNASWVQDGQGNDIGVQGSTRDITERKQLEKEIIESKKRYQSVIDIQQEMVCRYLPDYTLTFVNDAYCRASGKKRSELLGNKYLIFTPYESLGEELAALKRLSPTQPSDTREFEVTLPDGRIIWQQWTDVGVFDESGKLIEIQGTGFDITKRKQSEDETRHQAQRAKALLQIASHLNTELQLDKVKSIICAEACNALQMQMSVYLRYDNNTQFFHFDASLGLPGEMVCALGSLSRDDIEILLNKQGKTSIISDLSAVPELPFVQTLLSHGFYIYAYSLVERDGLLLGLLLVGNDKKVDLLKENIELLAGLANQAASAITNARLFGEANNRLNQVQALRNIDLAITGSLDLRVTFQVVLDEVTNMLQADAAAILRLNSQTGILKYEHWRGFRGKDIDRIIIPLGEKGVGRVVIDRESVYIKDLRESEQSMSHVNLMTDEDFVAYYAVPLIVKGTVLGVLEVFHRELHVSDDEWLTFLETLAGQAAIAIDNAELFSKLERSNLDLLQAYDTTIEGWAHALDLKDEGTAGHSQRVTMLTMRIAGKMGIKEEELIHVRRGALLHDIGKMGIPDSILLKPGKLTDEEWAAMREHPFYAFKMISPIDYLRPALDIPYCHHEKWDGSGYPRGIEGKQIPLVARIFAVVDVYDALTSDRPYRKAWTRENTLEHIKEESGSHFDPQVVDVFLKEIGDLIL